MNLYRTKAELRKDDEDIKNSADKLSILLF